MTEFLSGFSPLVVFFLGVGAGVCLMAAVVVVGLISAIREAPDPFDGAVMFGDDDGGKGDR